jgi:hypothetical protein
MASIHEFVCSARGAEWRGDPELQPSEFEMGEAAPSPSPASPAAAPEYASNSLAMCPLAPAAGIASRGLPNPHAQPL